MTRLLPGLLLVILALPATISSAAPTTWRDSARDVYIDGNLDRPAQVLTADSPRRIAIFSTVLKGAVILDLEAQKVYTSPRSSWSFATDRLSATTSGILGRRAPGALRTTKDGVYLAKLGRRALTVTSHHSIAGPMTEAELFRDFPSWRAVSGSYEPGEESVATLKSVNEPLKMRIAFATWCGDSRNYVPKVLAAVRAAANPNIQVELVNIGPDFADPLGFIQENRIINVPTVVVENQHGELGRLTETPSTASVEMDMAAIVTGTLPAHQGRIARDARLASGRYTIVNANSSRPALEDWEVFATPSGGHLIHSVITSDSRVREIWQTFDKTGRTSFVEVTDRSDQVSRRTRYRVGTESITSQSRGNTTGIVDQIVRVPAGFTVDTSAIASAGFGFRRIADFQKLIDCFTLGDCGTTGELQILSLRTLDDEHVDAADTPRHALKYQQIRNEETEELWVDAELGVTLRRTGTDGSIATLTAFALH